MIRETDLQKWYSQWLGGRTKNEIERTELNDPKSHGKMITRLWRDNLGIETEEDHPMVSEICRLRQLLINNGIDPG